MREKLVNILGQMLSNNVGQQLTAELATGIATTFSQAAIQMEAALGVQAPSTAGSSGETSCAPLAND